MKLFRESIEYVQNLIDITDQLLVIIMQTRKIILFETKNDGLKKSGTNDLDFPTGRYHGAKLCESYLLNQLKYAMNKENIGLTQCELWKCLYCFKTP